MSEKSRWTETVRKGVFLFVEQLRRTFITLTETGNADLNRGQHMVELRHKTV